MTAGALPSVFAIWKPKGISSNEALTRLKKMCGTKKAGHAGTLDPLAEGILVVGVGRDGTKALSELLLKEKEYSAEIMLGVRSTTDDEEGEKTYRDVSKIPTQHSVERAISHFIGEIMQVPPRYSAVHVKGKKAYTRARMGEAFLLAPRPVQIKSVEILSYVWPKLSVQVVTGPGAYIRALARDIGEELGTGGYLSSLVRTRVGDFTRKNVIPFEALYGYESH
ncbi:MAG: tRNA pseudouridine(55) synthase TruB [Candidatus Sungbacteria bacterium RIFCSPHIGHO2_01_FULL_50_25]|uniref:tRNA pseudouridine synthase B n=1 Tax=Candidatus Sungbacteria bacterium RIFCSPHIGHO2_01_FULL_50_25 TaxID=1802265 RepID=A0A1G2KB33_9BACT|nr:MAG: tRNA pseudouridine(55) synthase TruB [Candidatus Sungbacteria bacterium RIFCSPHIGHO2_01_FULL_50_25]